MSFSTINPATNKIIQCYDFQTAHEIEDTLKSAHSGYKKWSTLALDDRIKLLGKFRVLLGESSLDLAKMATIEMGKPLAESIAELKKCCSMIEFYLEHAPKFLAEQELSSPYKQAKLSFCSQGVILGIMPWNFPYWQVLRFAIPTLLTGNTVIIKHAPNVQGSQDLLQKVFDNSGMLSGVFSTIIVDIPQIETVISDDRIRGVSFTGSERAGRSVGSLAGKHLKKSVLELGGSDPYLILEDADISLAAKACVASRFINSGQSCVAAKRWIVDKKVEDQFLKEVLNLVRELKVGNPLEENLNIGPMARVDLKNELLSQVKKSLEKGATIALGDLEKIETDDCFFPPLVLTNVKPGQPAFDEELFGPVGVVITADSTEEAIKLANKSRFGLGGAIFSQDVEKAKNIAKNGLDTGGVFINDFYKSTPELPFGGVKASGLGRELSHLALYEFANIKTIAVN